MLACSAFLPSLAIAAFAPFTAPERPPPAVPSVRLAPATPLAPPPSPAEPASEPTTTEVDSPRTKRSDPTTDPTKPPAPPLAPKTETETELETEAETITSSSTSSEPQPSEATEPSPTEGNGGTEPFELQPPAPDSQPSSAFDPRKTPWGSGRRKPVWGQLWVSGSFHAGFGRVGLGASVTRFLVPRLGLGLDLDDEISWGWPGAYNLFQLTPKATFVLLPYHRVTPIAHAGFGGAFFSHKLGVYGRWVVGTGLMFAIRERLRMGFGLDFEGFLPQSRFYRHFECQGTSLRTCHRQFTPWVAFGIRG